MSIFLAFWSSQWWLPKMAPALLAHSGLSVESAERTETGRMRLKGLGYQADDGLQLLVDVVEVPNLWDYARARWFAAAWSASQQLELGVVAVRLPSENRSNDSEAEAIDLPETIEAADRMLSKVRPWLPPLYLQELSLRNSGGDVTMRAENLRFDGSDLEAELYAGSTEQMYPFSLSLMSGKWSFEASDPSLGFEARARLEPTSEQLQLNAQLTYARQVMHFEAVWRGAGIVPHAARLRGGNFSLPQQLVERAHAPGLNSVHLSRADLKWAGQRYEGGVEWNAGLEIEGHPAAATGAASFEGDFRELRILGLKVDAPWAKAALEAPLVIRLPELELEKTADFRVSADLSRQPFVSAGGMLAGNLTFQPPAQLRFELSGRSVVYQAYPASDLEVVGSINKEALKLEKVKVAFDEASLAQVELNGSVNFRQSLIDFDYEASFSPEWADSMGLPDLLRETAYVKGGLGGPRSAPQWSAVWEVPAVQPPGLQVFRATGAASGTGASDIRMEATLVHGREQLGLALELEELSEEVLHGSLDRLLWEVDGRTRWELGAPGVFSVPVQGSIHRRFEELALEEFLLAGPDSAWRISKTSQGPLLLAGREFQLDWLNPWLDAPLPQYGIRSADLTVSQLSPFVAGQLSLTATDDSFELGELQINLEGLRIGERTEVPSLGVVLGDASLIEVMADLPVRLEWATGESGPVLKPDRDGAIRLQLGMKPSDAVSELIRKFSELAVEPPRLNLEIDGTLRSPNGRLEAFLPGIKLRETLGEGPKQVELPGLNDIEVRLGLDGQSLHLKRLKARIRGGLVEASGRWPLETFPLFEGSKSADWFNALLAGAFELSFAEWELQNWTPYLPSMLRRSGLVGGRLRHDPDSGFGGSLQFKELGLRPTRSLPSVDSSSGALSFEGRALRIVEAGARVGGSPVSLQGQMDFADWPEIIWQAEIKGKNVPIVRRPEMILRSDLDLKLSQKSDQSAPALQGRMGLRSSTMLVEFDPLSPAVRSGPSSKPPFFAIEEEPFSRWGLDLRIEGERFLRVRSPYFQSVLSAGLNLTGRLGEPLLLGSIRIAEGSLSFPGAKVRLDTGEAYIESGQPDALRLDVAGTARTGTHVITMDVSGTASDPQIQFDATPPLPNASIVRLLSTGSTTGGGAGSVGLYLGRGLLGAGGMNESFADRITIDVGEETTRSGKSTLGVRYEVNEDVYLNSEYDAYDNYNTDLLWTIFEK
ncbi:translocation/assembly module TamB domain-containing protein [Coraliomargarita sinensis]|nr:translocation/assembly module TamB domain-containing protein [Coraliomargarita sinensis]